MLLDLLGDGQPDHTAISANGLNITYDNLRKQVERAADDLAKLGLGRGDRIAMALPNGLEVIVAFLAASITGTAAPLNPAYRLDEFKFYLEDTNASVLIVPPKDSDAAREAAGDNILIIEIDVHADGQVRLSSAGNVGNPRKVDYPAPDDIALILHTSGTTSRPKRVPLSHRNIETTAKNVADTYALTPQDVSLCVMPLFHVHGLVASTLSTFRTGGTVVVPPKFN